MNDKPWDRIGGDDPRGGWIANLQELARIGKRPAANPSQLHPCGGAPDPVALRAIPATVPGMLDCLVEGLIG